MHASLHPSDATERSQPRARALDATGARSSAPGGSTAASRIGRPGPLKARLRIALGQRLSIRGRLLLLLLALAVPFTSYLALSVWRQSIDERMRAGERMLGMARLTAARLDDHVGDVRQALEVLAQVAEPSPDDAAANDVLLHRLKPRLPAQILSIGIWNAEGTNAGTSDDDLPARPPTIGQLGAFRHAAATGAAGIEAPVATGNGEKVAVFVLPILKDGRFAGAVTASTNLRTLQGVVSPEGLLESGALITVLDTTGRVMARSIDADRWIGRTVRKPGEAPQPHEGVFGGPSRDGIERIGGLAASRRTQWVVYVGIPTSVALATVRVRIVEYALLGTTMLLLGLFVAARVGRRISIPLRQLGDDAAALERGDWSHRSTVHQGGEIGRLATLMNRMAATVEERTALLVASENNLREITDNLPVMISCLDREERFVFANRLYDEWLGVAPETLVGKTLEELYGASAYGRFRHHIAAGLAGERVVYERDLDSRGQRRRVEVTLVPRRDAAGGVEGLFVLMQDVTENRDAVERRVRSEQRLSLALEGAGAALFDWDIAARSIYHSAYAGVLRGEPAIEGTTPASRVRRWVHAEDAENVQRALERTFSGATEQFDAEFRLAQRGGEFVWVRGRGRVVERDANGAATRFAGTCSDISARKLIEERLRHQATYDTLTGLPNRALFHDRLAQAMARHARSRSGVTAVLYLDIDHFKAVNDTYGHETGDRLLADFARTLQASVRSSDTVARLAGDEFSVILEGLRAEADAMTVARLLVERARQTVGTGAEAIRVSASIGIAFLRAAEDDAASILRRADAALYDAKRGGRDRHAVHRSAEAANTNVESSLVA